MKKEFTADTIQRVRGNVPGLPLGRLSRTPLHVEFSSQSNRVNSKRAEDLTDPKVFNAVGSRNDTETGRGKYHLPVIDADGGAEVQQLYSGSKAVLRASHEGQYNPQSLIRDVLGDNGIDVEVFQYPKLETGTIMPETHLKGMYVGAIVLRSVEQGIFEAVDSTTENHSHLYIQKAFEDYDHKTLIQELGSLGIISQAWLEATEQEGMGIVRTPWTAREVHHHTS